MKVALVAIAKNEDNYIDEWLNYYIKLGFDHIFVYQNNWRCKLEYPFLTKIEWDGYAVQKPAYNDFVNKNIGIYSHAAFFDIDEFLVLKKHKNIKQFLKDYDRYDSLGINWVMFGDNYLVAPKDDFSLIKRFTLRAKSIHPDVKTITKLKKGLNMEVHSVEKNWFDLDGNFCSGFSNRRGNDKIAQINHYFCKTLSEYIDKSNRGVVCSGDHVRGNMQDFEKYNLNEIEDLSAYNFMYGKKIYL